MIAFRVQKKVGLKNTLLYCNQPWTIRKVMGEGGAKAKKKFPRKFLIKKNIPTDSAPKKYMPKEGKKKKISTLHIQKRKILHLLKSPLPPSPTHHSGAGNLQH